MPEFIPCPFCGNAEFHFTTERSFYEVKVETGSASIRMTCSKCSADMWEHSWGERDYDKRIQMLADKWNRRVSGERI